jgi:hypothetical protein
VGEDGTQGESFPGKPVPLDLLSETSQCSLRGYRVFLNMLFKILF